MPAPSDPIGTDRLEALLDGDLGDNERERELQGVLRELRAAKPPASQELRARVAGLRQPESVPRWRLARLRPSTRVALVLAGACVLAVAGALASSRGGGDADRSAEGGGAVAEDAAGTGGWVVGAPAEARSPESASPPVALAEPTSGVADSSAGVTTAGSRAALQTAPAPAPARAQDYRADLTVLVEDVEQLSAATQQAMRITRSLGGFVVTANFGKPVGEDGDSTLSVRVPVTRVQEAIAQFGELGTVIAQNISIQDLQGQLNRQVESIADLRKTVARIEQLLEDTSLSAETRARLELQLDNAKRTLAQRKAARDQTLRTARLSHVSLTLTTRDEGVVVPPKPPSEFEQTLRDALSILGTTVAWLLAAVIVMSPFIALVLAAWLLSRTRIRRANAALLERS